jgi:hypothetical protein
MYLSNSPFSLAVASNHQIVAEATRWPTCAGVLARGVHDEAAVRRRTRITVSFPDSATPHARASEVPAWFYGDIRDAVRRKFQGCSVEQITDHQDL